MIRHDSILLLVKAALNLHAHVRLRKLNLVYIISFILSLKRILTRRLSPVVEHGFEVYVVYFYRHFTLILWKHGEVNQRGLLLGEITYATACQLDSLSFFRRYFFAVKDNQLRHTLQH